MIEQSQPTSENSSILITFGQQSVITERCPTQINTELTLCSSKGQIENMRFNIAEYLKTDIPSYSVMIEICATDDGEELCAKLEKIIATSEALQDLKKDSKIDIKVLSKNQKVYLVVFGQHIVKAIEKIQQKMMGTTKIQEQVKLINITMKSLRNIEQTMDDIQNKDVLVGLLSSFMLQITFIKSPFSFELVNNLISKGMKTSAADKNLLKMMEKFEKFNLKIKCQSGQAIQNFTQILGQIKVPLKVNFKPLNKDIKNNVNGYFFGKKLSAKTNIKMDNCYLLLDLLLS